MSQGIVWLANFTVLFISFCHAIISGFALKGVESAQKRKFNTENKLPSCLLLAHS